MCYPINAAVDSESVCSLKNALRDGVATAQQDVISRERRRLRKALEVREVEQPDQTPACMRMSCASANKH